MTGTNENSLCISCRKPSKSMLQCQICEEPVCKSCELFLEEGSFSFRKELAPELKHTHYCPVCHDTHVAPALEQYAEQMERARQVYFFFTTQKKPVPVLKRGLQRVRVESCVDREETILRLAFQAVELGFNAVIEAEVTSEKVRNSGYQKSNWRGVGLPARVDEDKLERSARH